MPSQSHGVSASEINLPLATGSLVALHFACCVYCIDHHDGISVLTHGHGLDHRNGRAKQLG
jgi:hypothetical protein